MFGAIMLRTFAGLGKVYQGFRVKGVAFKILGFGHMLNSGS